MGLLKGRITDIADPIIDGAVAIITLTVFALIIPIIVKVLGAVSTTQAEVNQIGQAVNQIGANQQIQVNPVSQGLNTAGSVAANTILKSSSLSGSYGLANYPIQAFQSYFGPGGGFQQLSQAYQQNVAQPIQRFAGQYFPNVTPNPIVQTPIPTTPSQPTPTIPIVQPLSNQYPGLQVMS